MGECRRHAPQPAFEAVIEAAVAAVVNAARFESGVAPRGQREDMDGAANRIRTWPMTYEDDWCGEFQAAPGKGPSFV